MDNKDLEKIADNLIDLLCEVDSMIEENKQNIKALEYMKLNIKRIKKYIHKYEYIKHNNYMDIDNNPLNI